MLPLICEINGFTFVFFSELFTLLFEHIINLMLIVKGEKLNVLLVKNQNISFAFV